LKGPAPPAAEVEGAEIGAEFIRRYKFSNPNPQTGLPGSTGEPLPVPSFEAIDLYYIQQYNPCPICCLFGWLFVSQYEIGRSIKQAWRGRIARSLRISQSIGRLGRSRLVLYSSIKPLSLATAVNLAFPTTIGHRQSPFESC